MGTTSMWRDEIGLTHWSALRVARYLVRVPRGWTPDHELAKSDPIVFIHGLGFGLVSVSLTVARVSAIGVHGMMYPNRTSG